MSTEQIQLRNNLFTRSLLIVGLTMLVFMAAELVHTHLLDIGKRQLGLFVSIAMIIIWLISLNKLSRPLMGTKYFIFANLIGLGLGTILGSIIPQGISVEELTGIYGNFGSQVLRILQIDELFYSWWFMALLGLLSISLIKRAFSKPFRWKYLGFHMALIGPVVIIIGLGLVLWFSFHGTMKLGAGQQSHEYLLSNIGAAGAKEVKEIGFFVHLDSVYSEEYDPEFEVQVWHMPEITQGDPHLMRQGQGADPEFITSKKLKSEKNFRVPNTDLYFRLVEFYPNFDFSYSYPSKYDSIDAVNPGVLIEMKAPGGEAIVQLKMEPEGRNIIDDKAMPYSIEYYWELPEDIQDQLDNAVPGSKANNWKDKVVIHGQTENLYFLSEDNLKVEPVRAEQWVSMDDQDSVEFQVKFLFRDAQYIQSKTITKDQNYDNPVAKMEVWGSSWPNSQLAYLYPSKGGMGGIYQYPNAPYLLSLSRSKDQIIEYLRADISFLNMRGEVIETGKIGHKKSICHKGRSFCLMDQIPDHSRQALIEVKSMLGLWILFGGFVLFITGIFVLIYQSYSNKMYLKP